MIVREPAELAYLREQEARAAEEEAMEQHWAYDSTTLAELVKRWGVTTILREIAAIHDRTATDGSKVRWSVPSDAFVMGGYDDPNPCSCDEEF